MNDTGSSSSSSASGGVGFVGLLTVLFIALKLIPYKDHHIIDWPWFWVLSPIWITFCVVLLVLTVMAFGFLIYLFRKGK